MHRRAVAWTNGAIYVWLRNEYENDYSVSCSYQKTRKSIRFFPCTLTHHFIIIIIITVVRRAGRPLSRRNNESHCVRFPTRRHDVASFNGTIPYVSSNVLYLNAFRSPTTSSFLFNLFKCLHNFYRILGRHAHIICFGIDERSLREVINGMEFVFFFLFLSKLTISQRFSYEEIANECECGKDDAIQ